jgi:hypothetical protein
VSESTEPSDTSQWHKRFAMDCNNRAWALSVQVRTESEDRELLDAAHASAWHWAQVGTELNRMRATTLLAEVHASLGMGASAMALAERMRSYFLGRDTPDWELACVHAVYAHAAHAAGRVVEHREAFAKASQALAAIADEEDRKIIAKTLDQVPRP